MRTVSPPVSCQTTSTANPEMCARNPSPSPLPEACPWNSPAAPHSSRPPVLSVSVPLDYDPASLHKIPQRGLFIVPQHAYIGKHERLLPEIRQCPRRHYLKFKMLSASAESEFRDTMPENHPHKSFASPAKNNPGPPVIAAQKRLLMRLNPRKRFSFASADHLTPPSSNALSGASQKLAPSMICDIARFIMASRASTFLSPSHE